MNSSYTSMTAAVEGGEWSAARLGRTLPPGKAWYPLYRMLGGPQGRSGRAENLAPPEFESRTVQPVAQSLYRLSYAAPTLWCKCNNYIREVLKSSCMEPEVPAYRCSSFPSNYPVT